MALLNMVLRELATSVNLHVRLRRETAGTKKTQIDEISLGQLRAKDPNRLLSREAP
jgi:hypothetical protein